MRILQIIATLVALALGFTALALGLSEPTSERADDTSGVLLDYEINNDNAESAPQQQVVNGWIAKDLLTLQVDRADRLIEHQQQTNRLVGLVAAAIGLTAAALALRPQPDRVVNDLASGQQGNRRCLRHSPTPRRLGTVDAEWISAFRRRSS